MKTLRIVVIVVFIAAIGAAIWGLYGTKPSNLPTDNEPLQPISSTGTSTIQLKVGGQFELPAGFTVTLDQVTSDSRCPADVQCFHAGWADIELSVVGPSYKDIQDVRLGQSITIGGWDVAFLGLSPEPQSDQSIEQSDYVVSLTLSPAQTTPTSSIPTDIQDHINSKADLITVSEPAPNASINSPLTISGMARGQWFFEGDFPIILTDWDGRIIAEHYATATGDWMTTEFVPFTATLEFEVPVYGDRGTLIFQKDNPSDLPENDDALEIPVQFAPAPIVIEDFEGEVDPLNVVRYVLSQANSVTPKSIHSEDQVAEYVHSTDEYDDIVSNLGQMFPGGQFDEATFRSQANTSQQVFEWIIALEASLSGYN
jgi:hypothetical protein